MLANRIFALLNLIVAPVFLSGCYRFKPRLSHQELITQLQVQVSDIPFPLTLESTALKVSDPKGRIFFVTIKQPLESVVMWYHRELERHGWHNEAELYSFEKGIACHWWVKPGRKAFLRFEQIAAENTKVEWFIKD